MDSFSFSFWGHRSENWAKKICCHLQNLNSKATVLQRHSSAEAKSSGNSNIATPIDVCLWLPSGSRCFQRELISKRGLYILIMKRPSVIHAALGITVTTLKSNVAHFQY